MARVMPHLREPLDDVRHPRQRPEIGTEPRDARAGAQGPLDLPQLRHGRCQRSPYSEPPGSGKLSHPGSPILSQQGRPC
jgi:hypothetical protein